MARGRESLKPIFVSLKFHSIWLKNEEVKVSHPPPKQLTIQNCRRAAVLAEKKKRLLHLLSNHTPFSSPLLLSFLLRIFSGAFGKANSAIPYLSIHYQLFDPSYNHHLLRQPLFLIKNLFGGVWQD